MVVTNTLAADPTIARDMDLGQAWHEAEAALPHPTETIIEVRRHPDGSCMAFAYHEQSVVSEGDNPTEALRNLTAALREGLAE